MPPVSQKADIRPITFVLHDTAAGTPPLSIPLVVRPEDLTRTEPSRLAVQQTLGGAWADNFGIGLPTVSISGTTGWGQGNRPSGIDEFTKLHDNVFTRWHTLRDAALKKGLDPDKVLLIFSDKLDDFTWVVTPNSFVLKRSKSRPLLMSYQIQMTWLSDDVAETINQLASLKASGAELGEQQVAIDSLTRSLDSIKATAEEIQKNTTAALAPIKAQVVKFVNLTASYAAKVIRTVKAVVSVPAGVVSDLIQIGQGVMRAGINIANAVASVLTLPQQIRAQFQRLASAYTGIFCVLKNLFRRRKYLSPYDIYGAGTCTTTAGGHGASRYLTENTFAAVMRADGSPVSTSESAKKAISDAVKIDPLVRVPSLNELGDMCGKIALGMQVAQ